MPFAPKERFVKQLKEWRWEELMHDDFTEDQLAQISSDGNMPSDREGKAFLAEINHLMWEEIVIRMAGVTAKPM